MLFSDTVICPECQHVLDRERAALISQEDLSHSRSKQIPCRSCGEANQIGLVRCWNCSSFLREDIQEAYYEMLRGHRETTYSQSQPVHNHQQSMHHGFAPSPSSSSEDDDDFELSDAYRFNDSPVHSSETYGLSKPPEPNSAPSNGAGAKTPAQASPAEQPKPEESETQEAKPPAAEASEEKRPPVEEDPNAEAHSVATGGDVLLDIALKEEQESESVRKRREAQRKKKRKSSKGRPGEEPPSPERLAAQKRALAKRQAAQKRAAEKKKKAEQKYGTWLPDIRQHTINPQKLRLKPGSVEKQFDLVDVGCSAQGVIVVSLAKKPALTLFSKPKGTSEEVRQEVRAHLEADKKKDELPAPKHDFFDAEAVKKFKVVQPVVYVHESMFAGVPVFGEGRIVVCLPLKPGSPDQRFLAFWLSEFRQFSAALESYFQIKDLGILEGVPLTDPLLDLKCHYSEQPLKVLDPDAAKLYEADPNIKLELAGWRCEGCGLVISEEARRKEKIGGLKGKAIAKAKCPKCEKKFGKTSLFQLAEPEKKPAEEQSSSK